MSSKDNARNYGCPFLVCKNNFWQGMIGFKEVELFTGNIHQLILDFLYKPACIIEPRGDKLIKAKC
jgi:hypothetical protein